MYNVFSSVSFASSVCVVVPHVGVGVGVGEGEASCSND